MRLSRRMRVRTQHSRRWQDCEQCQGQGCGGQSSWYRSRRKTISLDMNGALSLFLFVCCISLLGGSSVHVDGFLFQRQRSIRGLQLYREQPAIDTVGMMNLQQLPFMTMHPIFSSVELKMNDDSMDENDEGDGREDREGDEDILGKNREEPVVLHDLNWRVEKLRLEEANTRRFLKSGPRFLPYEECRKWVKAWNRWETETEWKNWIDEGEKRNSYIPARPDEYYGNRGEWKSWDHFLGVEKKKDEGDCEEESDDFQ